MQNDNNAPSTDEGEALNELREQILSTRMLIDDGDFEENAFNRNLLAKFEAAIRAPLEERIRALEVVASATRADVAAAMRGWGAATAENERLREQIKELEAKLNSQI